MSACDAIMESKLCSEDGDSILVNHALKLFSQEAVQLTNESEQSKVAKPASVNKQRLGAAAKALRNHRYKQNFSQRVTEQEYRQSQRFLSDPTERLLAKH